MPTLLMRLCSPLQSWGSHNSRFGNRDTGIEPSKSGVIGLLCAALGRPRTAPVDDLAALRMGVRVNREGNVVKDYHIVQDGITSNPLSQDVVRSQITERYYLSDADFLVGLESEDDTLLTELDRALQFPVYPLALGRKSCVPTLPVRVGIDEGILLEALKGYPAQKRKHRYVVEVANSLDVRQDVPISFAARSFRLRCVQTYVLEVQRHVSV